MKSTIKYRRPMSKHGASEDELLQGYSPTEKGGSSYPHYYYPEPIRVVLKLSIMLQHIDLHHPIS